MSDPTFTIRVVSGDDDAKPFENVNLDVWAAARFTALATDEIEDVRSATIEYLDGTVLTLKRETHMWAPPTGQPVSWWLASGREGVS
jgi:hypothetical protein